MSRHRRREKPDETTDDTKPGRKADTIRGWSRGTGHPLPVVDATITLTSMAGATRTGKTDRRGRLWVEKLDDDGWFLDLTPTADELSSGIALPTKDIDHGTDWTSGGAPGQRSITREAKLKTKRRFDIESRPFQLFITVENGAIITVGVSNPKKAKGRPHHAMAFWLDVERDDHDKKNGNELVEQVLEIDLKPDFLRKVYKKDEKFTGEHGKHATRPIAKVRKQDIDLFQIHHTAGAVITGTINDMINLSVKRKSGKKEVQFKGVHFINDRDGHVSASMFTEQLRGLVRRRQRRPGPAREGFSPGGCRATTIFEEGSRDTGSERGCVAEASVLLLLLLVEVPEGCEHTVGTALVMHATDEVTPGELGTIEAEAFDDLQRRIRLGGAHLLMETCERSALLRRKRSAWNEDHALGASREPHTRQRGALHTSAASGAAAASRTAAASRLGGSACWLRAGAARAVSQAASDVSKASVTRAMRGGTRRSDRRRRGRARPSTRERQVPKLRVASVASASPVSASPVSVRS